MSGRVRAVVCGLLGAGTVGAVVAGLPLLLYHFGGWPLPRRVPDWHEVAAGLMSQDSGAVVLAAVRDCSWLGWLLFTLACWPRHSAGGTRTGSASAADVAICQWQPQRVRDQADQTGRLACGGGTGARP